jgi:hypothetical protein
MKLNKNILKRLIRVIADTRSDEIGCEQCFRELDSFADLKLDGKSAEEAMPLLQYHLDHCKVCREEYEALLQALKEVDRIK